jgi:hypothetical protein
MNKATYAKLAGWGQLFITALAAAIQAHGVPNTSQAWLTVLTSAVVALAVHHASSTDGSK